MSTSFKVKATCPNCKCEFSYMRPIAKSTESKEEVTAMFEEIEPNKTRLPEWELKFIQSLKDQINRAQNNPYSQSLSQKQIERLKEIRTKANFMADDYELDASSSE